MAKKIRFSLEMENGRKIRTLDELRENFSLTKVVEYFDDQKLFHWLEDRYYTEQVEKLKQLNEKMQIFIEKYVIYLRWNIEKKMRILMKNLKSKREKHN
ncbi:MAG: hypothetical protein ACLSGV_00945 [Eubacterium sp.]